ncbi:hypothetical protein ACJJTC_009057 [Scirpophaga incertulas]
MPRGIHTSKRQSGFQQRKAKKAKMDEIQSMSGSLFKYVTKADSGQSSSKVPESPADESNDSHLGDSHSDSNIDNTESMKTTQDLDGIKINNENDEVNATFGDSISFEESVQHLRDVSHWSLPVPDNVRIDIIKKGSEHFQNKEGPFPTVSRHGSKIKGDSRHLSQEWFYKPMPSGEKILRSWMIFSPISNNLYCFCCRLFAVSNIQTTFTTGFQKWWKLNPKVLDHETSCEHLENFEKWKTLEMRLKSHTTIDDAALQLMNTEKQKWKNLLSRLLDITLFLAKQNLAFRGHDETKGSSNKGNFLELVKLLSKYDAVLKEHILYLEQEKSPKVTYLSPEIQNEFINVLANHIALQSKGLCVDEIIIKLEALRLFIGEKRLHLAEEAIDFAVQKSEKYNISMERRIRRKKRMPGELASSTDAGLTLRAELQKDMLECIDRFNIELETRVKSIKDVASLFEVLEDWLRCLLILLAVLAEALACKRRTVCRPAPGQRGGCRGVM